MRASAGGTQMSVETRIATPEGKRRYVRQLFATIADRYDFITVLLSYGRDRHWKRRLVSLAAPAAGSRALDLATGTGDIAFELQARSRVVGIDVTRRMIELANRKASDRGGPRAPVFLVADMLALPFKSESFDLVTTGYGLRNVTDLSRAVDEMFRVLKPGGQALSLDFNRPDNRLVRAVYLLYLAFVGSAAGWLLHRDPDTYRYIPASIRQYPGAAAVVDLMKARGFEPVRYHPILQGLMAMHHARKPESPCA
jgi:demethylmenaquinone methyltransferase/2-methoxy-6-polyprenyl-1,4-benzoquinol methylase